MNTQEYWRQKRDLLEKEGQANRDSQSVAFGLLDAYDGLTPDQQLQIHPILAEWLVSDDNALRYDAGFLISQRRIRPMAGAIEKAIALAEVRSGAEATYELRKLRRILEDIR